MTRIVMSLPEAPTPAAASSDHGDAATQWIRLLDIMARLRAPDGCPWDQKQTLQSLRKYVLEEHYELLDAMDANDHDGIREELGDCLLQAVFIAQVESEAGRFTMGDALRAIGDKLVRRHPHVFARESGEPSLTTADEVKVRWDAIKAEERAAKASAATPQPDSLLAGVPQALPSLLRAYQIGARAQSVGFDWTTPADVMTKVREEVEELAALVDRAGVRDADRAEDEMGDLLFSIANLARHLGIEPEAALRRANGKFTRRFMAMEQAAAATQSSLAAMDAEALDAAWRAAKAVTDGEATPHAR